MTSLTHMSMNSDETRWLTFWMLPSPSLVYFKLNTKHVGKAQTKRSGKKGEKGKEGWGGGGQGTCREVD